MQARQISLFAAVCSFLTLSANGYCQSPINANLTADPQIQVNTYTTGAQSSPSVAANTDGEVIISWGSSGQDGDGFGIVAQRLRSRVYLGIQFQVNAFTTGNQAIPAAGMARNGDFVVVWQTDYQDGDGPGIAGKRYNSAGVLAGTEFVVNTTTAGTQNTPKVAIETLDDFRVVWHTDSDGDLGGIASKEYAAGTPLGEEFINEVATGDQDQPDIARDETTGDFLVFWRDEEAAEGAIPLKIAGKKYKKFGQEGGPPPATFTIATAGTNSISEGFPSGEYNANGNFITVWQRDSLDGSQHNIFAKMFNADTTPIGSEFQVNTFTTGYQGKASVALNNEGNFVIVWRSVINSGVREDIRARVGSFSAGGLVGDEFQINSLQTYDLGGADVVFDGATDFLVVWHSIGSVGNDTSSLSIQSRAFSGLCSAFGSCVHYDGFESGDTSKWSSVAGVN